MTWLRKGNLLGPRRYAVGRTRPRPESGADADSASDLQPVSASGVANSILSLAEQSWAERW